MNRHPSADAAARAQGYLLPESLGPASSAGRSQSRYHVAVVFREGQRRDVRLHRLLRAAQPFVGLAEIVVDQGRIAIELEGSLAQISPALSTSCSVHRGPHARDAAAARIQCARHGRSADRVWPGRPYRLAQPPGARGGAGRGRRADPLLRRGSLVRRCHVEYSTRRITSADVYFPRSRRSSCPATKRPI